MMLTDRILFSLLLAASTAAPAAAQDAAQNAAEGERHPLLVAIQALDSPSLALTGKVHQKAGEDDDMFGIEVVGGPEVAEPFRGAFELFVDGEEIVIASKSPVPGVVIYAKGTKTLVQTTVRDDGSLDAAPLRDELRRFADAGRLRRAFERAIKKDKVVETTDPESGAKSWAVSMAPGYLPADDPGMMGMTNPMAPSVKGLEAVVAASADGTLAKVSFEVTWTDPMGALQEAAMSGELGGGGDVTPEDIAALAAEGPGKVVHFEFAPGKTPRAKALLGPMRELAQG